MNAERTGRSAQPTAERDPADIDIDIDKTHYNGVPLERMDAERAVNGYLQGPLTVERYTFFIPAGDYRVHCHRHGEPWIVFEAGCNAVSELMSRIEELEALEDALPAVPDIERRLRIHFERYGSESAQLCQDGQSSKKVIP